MFVMMNLSGKVTGSTKRVRSYQQLLSSVAVMLKNPPTKVGELLANVQGLCPKGQESHSEDMIFELSDHLLGGSFLFWSFFKMRKYSLFFMLLLLSGSVNAKIVTGSPETENGCGANCFWSFDTETGVLDITGSGEMDNWNSHRNNVGQEFYKEAPWFEYREQITSINIGEEISSIGNYAFDGTNVSTVDIPDSVTRLGDFAFFRSNIESITIPNTVTTLGTLAFNESYHLKNITLPDNMTEIPRGFFYAAYELSEIIIPDSVEKIGSDAFLLTNQLQSLIVPENVTNINPAAFCSSAGCTIPLKTLYCTGEQMETVCSNILKPYQMEIIRYEKEGNDYLVYDDKGNVVGKYASAMNLSKGMATETYKYDSAGHLVGIFDGNGQRTWGKKIYTVEEAMEVTKNGDKFHVYLTYK